MTDTVRRPARPPAAPPAPGYGPAPKPGLNPYRKAETPFGTVYYRRPDTLGPPAFGSGRKAPAKGPAGRAQGPGSRKPGGAGASGGPPRGPWSAALDAALDRELPLAVERLQEAEKVLAESAGGVLDLAESLQRETESLASFPAFAERGDLTARLRLGEFSRASGAIATGLFEKSSFHDLCGQRIAKVREALLALNSLLGDLKSSLGAGGRFSGAPARAYAGQARPAGPRRSQDGPPRRGRPAWQEPEGAGGAENPEEPGTLPRRAGGFRYGESGGKGREYQGKGSSSGDDAPRRKTFRDTDRDFGESGFKGKGAAKGKASGSEAGEAFEDQEDKPFKGTGDKPFKDRGKAFKGTGDKPYKDGGKAFKGKGDKPFKDGGKAFKDGGKAFKDRGKAFKGKEGKPFKDGGKPFKDGGKPFKDGGKASGSQDPKGQGSAKARPLKPGKAEPGEDGFPGLVGPSAAGLSQADIEKLLDELTKGE
ncbi:MAG: hypothetical protein LBW85_10520 [Deltaproteobacteria bacterium]|nr:hypothetical protein [Deltaproteobacteria bacterium]